MARWITRVWVADTRKASERTKSGRVKSRKELVTNGDIADATKAAHEAAAKITKDKRAGVVRMVIEQENETTAGGDLL